MFQRILTTYERDLIEKFLGPSKNRPKPRQVRVIVWRAKKHLPLIEEETRLLHKLLEAYESR